MTACIACEGSGKPSRSGGDCVPCAGTGLSLTWVSPTAVSTQRLCRRKRWYRQVAKIHRPPHPSAQLGSDVHRLLERYLIGAGEIDSATKAGAIAIKGLHLLPAPPQAYVELAPMFPRTDAYGYHGKIDLFYPYPLTVIDHKTSSNPRRYGLTPESLPKDPQAIVYSWLAMRLIPNATIVNLQWNYFPTRKGKPYPVRVQMQRNYVECALKKIDVTAEEIIRDNRITDAEQVPGDISACGAYGGCGYADICSVPKQSSLALALSEGSSIKGRETMAIRSDILDRIRAATAQPAAPTPAETAAPTPAAPVSVDVAADEQQVAIAQQARELAAAQAPVPAPVVAHLAPIAPVPSVAAPAPAPPVAESPALQAVLAQLRGEQPPPAAPTPAAPAPMPPVAQATSVTAPRFDGATLIAPTPAAPTPAAPEPAAPNQSSLNESSYTLYVNCIPLGVDYVSADAIIAQANEKVCSEQNVTHYKAIEYGAGPGHLANAIAEIVQQMDGVIVILPGRESSDALHCLRFFAAKIVQGV